MGLKVAHEEKQLVLVGCIPLVVGVHLIKGFSKVNAAERGHVVELVQEDTVGLGGEILEGLGDMVAVGESRLRCRRRGRCRGGG